MRLGLRMQLLLVLGVLIGVTFVSLYFALRTYTEAGLRQLQQESALRLGRSVATHVAESRHELDETRLLALLSAEVQGGAVQAAFILDPTGAPVARAGAPDLVDIDRDLLRESTIDGPIELPELQTEADDAEGPYRSFAIGVKDRDGAVVTIVRAPRQPSGILALHRLTALYMGLSACLVLVVAYFALTRWILAPILELERGARRVAEGSRRFEPAEKAPREIAALGQSLAIMTDKLFRDEEALTRKVLEVEQKTRELERAQSSLLRSERLASVGRLAAGLAHEIGNPISALMGLTDLLLAGGLTPEEEKDFLGRMRREIARIHRILGDLLAFARPRSRDSKFGATEGSLKSAAEDVVALLRPLPDFRDFGIELELPPDLAPVPLSHEELTQILLNFIMNAADACERTGKVAISATQEEGRLLLTITDTGPGVPEATRQLIFEPFFSTKEVGKGTGLGLAVSRGLVEGAGGTIRLDESYEAGARFVIELPLPAEPQTALGSKNS
ncbi:MAG: hypothetical protein B6A08_18755 [Sorangiineae bacterium NIC37A_2]|jgi:two-component system NtrC family sensor kinase|nr:MAG: hypothetical protein B6A08_18755 [Sorangiineae bacterium NIC37A_2]